MKGRVQAWVCPDCGEVGDPFDNNCIIHDRDCPQDDRPVLTDFIPEDEAEDRYEELLYSIGGVSPG